MNKFSSSMIGALIGTFSYVNTSLANEIIIDLNSHTMMYHDEILNVRLEYPIVAPTLEKRKRYGNKRIFSISGINTWPNWENPRNGRRYPGGHPDNPLGFGRITFINSNEEFYTCAIHGAANISDLGRNLSSCCIRLQNKDIRELMKYTTMDTTIRILE